MSEIKRDGWLVIHRECNLFRHEIVMLRYRPIGFGDRGGFCESCWLFATLTFKGFLSNRHAYRLSVQSLDIFTLRWRLSVRKSKFVIFSGLKNRSKHRLNKSLSKLSLLMQKPTVSGVPRQKSSPSIDIVSDERRCRKTVIQRPAKKAATSCNSFRMSGEEDSCVAGLAKEFVFLKT